MWDSAEVMTGTLTGEAEVEESWVTAQSLAGHVGMSTLERAEAGDGVQESEGLVKLEMSSYFPGKNCKRN